MENLKRLSVSLLILCVSALILIPKKGFVFAGPPLSSDWIVTGTESYYDQVIVLNGNLIVENGGNLTFRKVTLKLNCTYDGQYNITVKNGGRFYVLDGSVITSVVPDSARYLFSVEGGFRMNNSELHEVGRFDLMSPPNGLNIFSEDAIVENSLFSHNAQGINIWNNGVIVRNNNITMNDHLGIGLWAGGAQASTIISNNHISLNPGGGIHAEMSSPTIVNNTITSNFGEGIVFWDEANPIIEDNIITLNALSGIFFFNRSNPTIRGNNITSNNEDGIRTNNYCFGVIEGNIIMNNSDGIYSHSYSNPLIQGNIITSNRADGIRCENNSLPEVHWNDIYGNQDYGIANEDPSVTVNATYNYWGDDPDLGKISGNVLYNPWLTKSIFFAEVVSPLSGETISSTVTISTKVDAQNGAHKVEFYIDDQLEYTDYDASYEWNWDTTQYTETEHKITTKVYDMFGLKISTSITVFVDNTPPTVSIKEPTPENMYYGTINVSVNATDNQELGNVHVRVDNTAWLVMTYDLTDFLWKYDLNTTILSDGQHTLMVLALDKASNPATTSTTLFTDNTPPTLAILTPQSGMSVGLTLIVDIEASDVSGISRIEFYLQDVLVYTVTDMPYQWSWDTTKYPNGEYTIIVKAYDILGHMKDSETTVTVKNVESPWWQTNFWTIIEVFVAVAGLILGIIAYLTRKREEKKKKK